MLVFGQFGPHAAIDAVAEPGYIGCRGGFGGGGVQRCEDELGGVEVGQVIEEGGFPGGGGDGEVGCCRRHGAEEGAEAWEGGGSYGCGGGWIA